MIENLTRALIASLEVFASGELDGSAADDIADMLWLARTQSSTAKPGLSQETSPQRSRDPASPASSPEEPDPETDWLDLTLAPDPGSSVRSVVPATAVGLRTPRADYRRLSAMHVLRAFKHIHRSGPPVIDLDATVDATADAGKLVVITEPRSERGMDAALVADTSAAMRACGNETAELEALLRRTGAFRSVTCWSLVPGSRPSTARDRGEDAGSAVLIRDRAQVCHHPDKLLLPSGRRLVLFVSDGVADHCYRDGLWQALRRWATVMPTAIVHILPERYRADSAFGGPTIFMRSPWPAAPNSVAVTQMAWWEDGTDSGSSIARGVPVPVLTLRPDALETWAQAITSGTTWIAGVRALTPPRNGSRPADSAARPLDRVRAFQAHATREAQTLAQILAGAPVLSWPLVRILQARLLPGTGASVLAEVVLGGLLERQHHEHDTYEEERFQIPPEISETLSRGATATQQWDIFQVITEYLNQNTGTGGDLRTLIADPGGAALADAHVEPFAALSHAVATRLGLQPQAREVPSRPSDEPFADQPVAQDGAKPSNPPPEFRSFSTSPDIAILGPPVSGKTTFFAALIFALARRNKYDLWSGWNVIGADSASRDQLVAWTTALADGHIFPAATPMSVERYRWLLVGPVWRTVPRRWLGTKRVRETVKVELALADASGELSHPDQSRHGPREDLIDTLANSRGIVLLFDPITEAARGDAFLYLYSVLAELAQRMVGMREFHDGFLPHYVAVCISKFDDLRVLTTAERLNLIESDPDDSYGFPRIADEDAREFFLQLCRIIGSDAELVLNTLEQYFRKDRIKYFVTSSIGFYVDFRTNVYDREDMQNLLPDEYPQASKIRGPVHPINVAEPIFWLVSSQLGVDIGD